MTTCQRSYVAGALPAARRHMSAPVRFLDWFVEARSHRVLCLVLGVWMINVFDLALTLIAHDQGILTEENPVARRFLQDGTVSIVLYKIGLVCIGSYPLLRFRRARIVEMGALVVLFAYALVAVRWHRCYDIFLTNCDTPDAFTSHAIDASSDTPVAARQPGDAPRSSRRPRP